MGADRPALTPAELADAREAWSLARRRRPLPTQFLPAAARVAAYALACAYEHAEVAEARPLFLHPDGAREGHAGVRGANALYTSEDLAAWLVANSMPTRPKGSGAMLAPGHSRAGDRDAPGDHQRQEHQAAALGWLVLDADGVGDWDVLAAALGGHGAAAVRWRSANHCPDGCARHPGGVCKWHAALPLRAPWIPPSDVVAARHRWKAELYPAARFVLSVVGGLAGRGFDPATDQMLSRFYAGAPTPGHGAVAREIHATPGAGFDIEAAWRALVDLGVEDPPEVPAALPQTDRATSAIGAAWGTGDGDAPMVRAFQVAGWYRHRLLNGKHAVDCPWEHLHSPGPFPADDTVLYDDGGFWCSHGHPEGKGRGSMAAVRDALPPAALAEFHAAWRDARERRRSRVATVRRSVPAVVGMARAVNDTATAEHVDTETGEVHSGEGPAHGGTVRRLRPARAVAAAPGAAAWKEALRRTDRGAVRPTKENAVAILAADPRWAGVLGYDEFREAVTFLRPPPFHADCAGPGEVTPGTALVDLDYDRIACWLAREYDCDMGTDAAGVAVGVAARQHAFHAVRAYLVGLTWDGTPRVGTWLHAYLGAADTRYTRHVGGWWLISAAARAMQPGAKVDHMLVLQDPRQGTRKSAALAVLGGAWFADTALDLRSKDGFVQLQGTWIHEVAELQAFDGVPAGRIKSFLSSRSDKYRPPYGRGTVEAPRQCVFAGTTNAREFLSDPTGDRRYWPVRTGCIAIEALARDRDQLWAEALHLYRRGTKWWPHTPELATLCAAEQQARYQADPWEGRVADWLTQRALLARDGGAGFDETPVDTGAVLLGAIALDPTKWTRRESTRVGEILHRLGWLAGGRPRGGAGGRMRMYVPSPEFLATLPPPPARDTATVTLHVPELSGLAATAPTANGPATAWDMPDAEALHPPCDGDVLPGQNTGD